MARNSTRTLKNAWRSVRNLRFNPPKVIQYVAQQWGPNRTDFLALISLDESPFKAVWPVTQWQLFGGRRWSFGITFYTQTPKLERQRKFRKLVNEIDEK